MTSIRQTILDALENLGVDVEDAEGDLFEQGLDSLTLVRLVLGLEKSLGIKLVQKEFDRKKFAKLASIEALVQNAQKGA